MFSSRRALIKFEFEAFPIKGNPKSKEMRSREENMKDSNSDFIYNRLNRHSLAFKRVARLYSVGVLSGQK